MGEVAKRLKQQIDAWARMRCGALRLAEDAKPVQPTKEHRAPHQAK